MRTLLIRTILKGCFIVLLVLALTKVPQNELRVKAADSELIDQRLAVFSTPCPFSHSSNDDPIVYPGQPGAAHRHDFFSNNSTNYATTTKSLTQSTTTCEDKLDRASYWVPSFGRKNNDGTITWVVPDHVTPYYNFGGAQPPLTQYPLGLRMIAGDSKNTSPLDTRFFFWQCLGIDSPNGKEVAEMPICNSNQFMSAIIMFPDCWDGINLDSPDHKSHMAYSGGSPDATGNCPPTHPVKVPELRLRVKFGDKNRSQNYHNEDGKGVLSSDLVTQNGSNNKGRSLHADFWNAWDEGRLKYLVENCLNQQKNCTPFNGIVPSQNLTLPGPYPTGVEPTILPTGTATTTPTIQPTVTITTTATPACTKKRTGDANCDDNVDLLDFEVFRKEFTGTATTRNADFNKDGFINLLDFEVWREGYVL